MRELVPAPIPVRPPAPAGRSIPQRIQATVAAAGSALEPKGVTSWLMWIVGIYLFITVSRFHQAVKILAILKVPMLLGLFSLFMVMSQASRWQSSTLKKSPNMMTLGVLLAFALAGIPLSLYPGRTLVAIESKLLIALALGLMMFAVGRTAKGRIFLTKALMAGIVGACVLALKRSRFDSAGRLAGGYSYDPNDLALLAVMGLPIAVWWGTTKQKGRYLVFASVPVLLYTIVKSQSRGGLLALCAVIVGFMLLSMKQPSSKLRKVARMAMMLAILAVPLAPGIVTERLASITAGDDYNRTSYSGRLNLWRRGMTYLARNPVTGVGLDNFRTAEGWDLAGEAPEGRGIKWSAPHNSFLQVAVELGLIPGLVFIWAFVRTLMGLVALARRADQDSIYHGMMALSLLGFCASAFFLSWGFSDLTYGLLGLSGAILLASDPAGGARAARRGAGRAAAPQMRGA